MLTKKTVLKKIKKKQFMAVIERNSREDQYLNWLMIKNWDEKKENSIISRFVNQLIFSKKSVELHIRTPYLTSIISQNVTFFSGFLVVMLVAVTASVLAVVSLSCSFSDIVTVVPSDGNVTEDKEVDAVDVCTVVSGFWCSKIVVVCCSSVVLEMVVDSVDSTSTVEITVLSTVLVGVVDASVEIASVTGTTDVAGNLSIFGSSVTKYSREKFYYSVSIR